MYKYQSKLQPTTVKSLKQREEEREREQEGNRGEGGVLFLTVEFYNSENYRLVSQRDIDKLELKEVVGKCQKVYI